MATPLSRTPKAPASGVPLPAPPPYDQPLVDLTTGLPSNAWSPYFLTTYTALASLFTDDYDALIRTNPNLTPEVEELFRRLALVPRPRDYTPEIAEIQARLALLPAPQNLQPQIDEVKSLVALVAGYRGQENQRISDLEARLPLVRGGQQAATGALIIFDTHANRANYPPTSYPLGTLYIESDTHVEYVVKYDSVTAHANEWYYASGTYVDVSANRPTLGAYDDGYLFTSSNHFVSWKWNAAGSYWLYIGGEDNGTLANIGTAGGAGGPTAHDVGMLYGATDVGHRFIWGGTSWSFAPGDPGSGWTTFTPTLYGAAGYFQLVSSAGATITGLTTPTGTSTGTITLGASVSPITGAGLWVRM